MFTVGFTFSEDSNPSQTGLLSFQTQHFKQAIFIQQGLSPFLVMIGDIQRIIGTPATALHSHVMLLVFMLL
jgi:hypothetical protein